MPRNKYPEETREKIVETATYLFMERGYDHTTVQDIIDNLGGLTKGAVYHHFKSKEDIMMAVAEKLSEGKEVELEKFISNKTMTGMEKLRGMIKDSLNSSLQGDLMAVSPDLKKCPQLFVAMVEDSMGEAARMVQRIIDEGIRDGSIHTEHPKEAAELFLLLTNVWMNPLIVKSSAAEIAQKFEVLNKIIGSFGFDNLLDEEMLRQIQHLQQMVKDN